MAVKMLGSLPKHYKDILKMKKEDQEPWMIVMKDEKGGFDLNHVIVIIFIVTEGIYANEEVMGGARG